MPPRKKSSTEYLKRNRPPRVHIFYELDTNGAQEKVELPFVMGVMADLSGKSLKKRAPLAGREFSKPIDAFNLDDYMASVEPRLQYEVDNPANPGKKIPVTLTFKKMEDFSPDAVANMALKDLKDARTQLHNIRSLIGGEEGPNVEAMLHELINSLKAQKASSNGSAPHSSSASSKAADSE